MDVRPEDAPGPGEVPGEPGGTAASPPPRRRAPARPRARTRKAESGSTPNAADGFGEPVPDAAPPADAEVGAGGPATSPAPADEPTGTTGPRRRRPSAKPPARRRTSQAASTAEAPKASPIAKAPKPARTVGAAEPTGTETPNASSAAEAPQLKVPKGRKAARAGETPATEVPGAGTDATPAPGPGKVTTPRRAPRPTPATTTAPAAPTTDTPARTPVLQLAERLPSSPISVPSAKVALSTSSVYPESVAAAFEIARRLGYDGIELMVFTDPISQDPDAIRALSDYHGIPVLSVHAPCLLVTQRVWSTDPWEKLRRSQAAAERLGASTVVVHPPFRWQRDYGRDFERGLAGMRDETDVVFAVENMYPWRARNREWAAYLPDWDPRNQDYPQVTLDLSHTAVSGTDAMAMAADLGDRLAHVHLADGTGLPRDEHLVPGRGNQQCDGLLEGLAAGGFTGTIVIEVSTRKAANRAEREADLAEALAFARLHLAAPVAERVAAPHPGPPA